MEEGPASLGGSGVLSTAGASDRAAEDDPDFSDDEDDGRAPRTAEHEARLCAMQQLFFTSLEVRKGVRWWVRMHN